MYQLIALYFAFQTDKESKKHSKFILKYWAVHLFFPLFFLYLLSVLVIFFPPSTPQEVRTFQQN
jgi:cytoskeletal protein RodZ